MKDDRRDHYADLPVFKCCDDCKHLNGDIPFDQHVVPCRVVGCWQGKQPATEARR